MKTIVNHLPLTKARVNLGQVVRRAHVNREFFILEKDGIPVVGLMHVDDLEDYLEMQNRSVKEQVQTSTAEYRRGAARSAHEFLSELKTPSSKRKKK
jgi:restriction endonuclease